MENLKEKKQLRKKNNYIRWIAVLSAFLIMLQLGFFIGWSSPNFAWLLSEESPIEATTSDISWIASLSGLGAIPGSILGSICMERIGVRRTLLIAYLFMGASWTCLLIADSIGWYYAARIGGSVPLALVHCCYSVYLGEISPPEIRGSLISMASTGSTIGTVLGILAETYLPKEVSSSFYLAAVLIGMMFMLWLKDTPYYFMKKDNLNGAKQSIEFYHADKETDKEFKEIQIFVEKSKSQKIKEISDDLNSAVIKRSMFAIFLLWGLPHLSGQGIILTYLEIILKNAKFNLVEPEEFVIYATIVKVTLAIAAVKLIDKVGRKVLLITSSIGTSIAMFSLGLYFQLRSTGFEDQHLQWLAIASILLYFISYPVGFLIVPGALLSEMFAEKDKSTAILMSATTAPVLGFVVTKSYQPIVDFAGIQFMFWIFSLLCLSGIFISAFLIIETKGKSFQEIQNELEKKWGAR